MVLLVQVYRIEYKVSSLLGAPFKMSVCNNVILMSVLKVLFKRSTVVGSGLFSVGGERLKMEVSLTPHQFDSLCDFPFPFVILVFSTLHKAMLCRGTTY